MKKLEKIKGPRDCSLVDVTLHIANLTYQYRQDRDVFQDERQTHETREEAHNRMSKAKDMCDHWKEIRANILKSTPADKEHCIMLIRLFYANNDLKMKRRK